MKWQLKITPPYGHINKQIDDYIVIGDNEQKT